MKLRYVMLATGLCLSLTACDGTKKALGFEKSVPDEYRVMSHPPLSLPPEYGLRPPRPGEDRPQLSSATDRAQKKLIGGSGSEAVGRSEAENLFLQQAGAEKADPNIRTIIGGEQSTLNTDPGFWDKLKEGTLISDKNKKEKGDAIDPYKEKEKLTSAPSGKDDTKADSDGDAGDASKE